MTQTPPSRICFRFAACRWAALGAILWALSLSASVSAQSFAHASPEITEAAQAGMSAERLLRISEFLSNQVKQKKLPGAVLAISRQGKLVYHHAVGVRDDESQAEMPANAVFDLSTLTQPVTAAAAMILHERGQWLLNDSLGQYLPAFRRAAPTVRELLRQSSGLSRSVQLPTGSRAAAESGKTRLRHSLQVAAQLTGVQFIEVLASAGQARPAGQIAEAGFSYDALGLAIEQVAAQSLGSFFLREIFLPLQLWDSGFFPAAAAADRLVRPPIAAGLEAQGITGWVAARDLTEPVGFDCGGACLSSTAYDYLRFVQMLMADGALNGKRILSRTSVQYMLTNRLAPDMTNTFHPPDAIEPGSFGYGLGVSLRPATAANALPGSPREFSVASETGPYFWADPDEQLAVVLLALVPQPENRLRLHRQVRALVRQAIDD